MEINHRAAITVCVAELVALGAVFAILKSLHVDPVLILTTVLTIVVGGSVAMIHFSSSPDRSH